MEEFHPYKWVCLGLFHPTEIGCLSLLLSGSGAHLVENETQINSWSLKSILNQSQLLFHYAPNKILKRQRLFLRKKHVIPPRSTAMKNNNHFNHMSPCEKLRCSMAILVFLSLAPSRSVPRDIWMLVYQSAFCYTAPKKMLKTKNIHHPNL